MIPKQAHQLRCDNVTCYSTVLFELQELLQYINPDSPAGKIIARRYNELWELRKGCATHSAAMTEHSIGKGELEYGTVSRDGVDWRLRRFDAGMGETEYRIFRNETFFAQFDNRDNADDVMEFVTGVHDATHSAAAEKIILCFGNYWTCPIDEEECKVSDACHQKAIHDREHDAAIAAHPAAPSQERIGSIRQNIYQEDAYLIERVNAGMGEWEYVIQYCGEYYATAPTENIARDIVERAQWSRPHPVHPTEAQQRIDAPLMRKEIVRIMIAGRHNNDRTYGEIADEIIALLQAGRT